MPTKIELSDRLPLRYVLNILDPRASPVLLDNEIITPIVNINEGGFLRAPDIARTIGCDVEVRNDSSVDPTIDIGVVIPGNQASAYNEMLYGISNNCYIHTHHILVSATDPVLLYNTTMENCSFEVGAYVYDPYDGGPFRPFVKTWRFQGQNDFLIQEVGDVLFHKCVLDLPLPPLVLTEGQKLRVVCNRTTFNDGGGEIATRTFEGLVVRYRGDALKIPIGAPVPQLRYR